MRSFIALALIVAAPVYAGSALSADEREVFRSQVQSCWMLNENPTAVVIGFSLDRSGRPDAVSMRLISNNVGSDAQISQAFAAAKRAVLRCGREGYDLPVEKYEQWRDIELTFDPERTILR